MFRLFFRFRVVVFRLGLSLALVSVIILGFGSWGSRLVCLFASFWGVASVITCWRLFVFMMVCSLDPLLNLRFLADSWTSPVPPAWPVPQPPPYWPASWPSRPSSAHRHPCPFTTSLPSSSTSHTNLSFPTSSCSPQSPSISTISKCICAYSKHLVFVSFVKLVTTCSVVSALYTNNFVFFILIIIWVVIVVTFIFTLLHSSFVSIHLASLFWFFIAAIWIFALITIKYVFFSIVRICVIIA